MSAQRQFFALAGPNIRTNSDESCPKYGLTEHYMSSSTEQFFLHEGAPSYAASMNKIGFGERLQQRRKELGLSGESLGKGLQPGGKDASRATISDWEAERHYPNVWQLREICLKLNMNSDYFLFGDITNSSAQKLEQIKALVTSTPAAPYVVYRTEGKSHHTHVSGGGNVETNASTNSKRKQALLDQLIPLTGSPNDERKKPGKLQKQGNNRRA